jgi:cell division protein YceG involved in septum cleavage
MSRPLRLLRYVVLALVLAAAVLVSVAWQRYAAFLATPLAIPPEGAVFVLEPGSTGADIVERLTAAGLAGSGAC